jgi:hypothetical protein
MIYSDDSQHLTLEELLKKLKENEIRQHLMITVGFKDKYEYLLNIKETTKRAIKYAQEEAIDSGEVYKIDEGEIIIKNIDHELEYLEKLMKLEEEGGISSWDRIKWRGSPAQFGYLFSELITHGFIDPPIHNGAWNYSAFARLCYQYFEISNKKGDLTTLEYLAKQCNPESCSLADTNREQFTIPDLKDLA